MKLPLFVALAYAALAAACAVAAPGPKAAPGPAQPPPKAAKAHRDLSHAETLTKRIHDDEAKLRTERDPVERDRLLNDIETTKHQLGPRDASGARLQFAAMWHDAAVESLDAEYKRLLGRAKAGGAAGASVTSLAMEARANLRRVAGTCLLRGWTWGGTLPKYQFDAYGTYLADNMPVLDAMFDSLAAALVKEASISAAAPDREAWLAALAQAKDGCAKMSQAAEAFTAAPETGRSARDREALVAALGSFHQGLETVYEGEAALRELASRQPKGDASAPPPPAEERPSAEEKAAIEKIRAVAEAIGKDVAWEKTRSALDRFSAVAEQGLATERARAGAMELLSHLARVAAYIDGLTKSRSAYPEYVAPRQEALADAFSYLTQKGQRQYAYSRLRRVCEGDRDRLALDASPLSVSAAQGLLRAMSLRSSAFPNAEGPNSYYAFDTARSGILDILAKLPNWPSKAMSPQLVPTYKKFLDIFVRSAEAAGAAKSDAPVALLETYQAAATFGKDLERVVVADQAIRAVEQYAPQRAAPMAADFLKRADILAGSLTVAAKTERTATDAFYLPFLPLADLRLPGPAHQQAAQSLTGGAYKNALATLGRQVTAALAEAARGKVTPLETALESRWMFKALRHRCVTEADGLAKTGVANLSTFSVPEKTYGQFVAALDQQVRRLIGRYAGEYTTTGVPPGQFLAQWDTVYCYIGAAQRQTLKARHPGQGDLDFLMRNLAQAADPTPPDSAWFGWAVGFHCVEAATCLAAGYERTAGFHLGQIGEHRAENRLDKELLPTAFDPK